MIPYKHMYFHLFNAITDALRCLDSGHSADAQTLLKIAQLDGEDMYLLAGDKPSAPEDDPAPDAPEPE